MTTLSKRIAWSVLVLVSASSAWAEPKEALPSLAPLVESVKSAVVNVDVQKHVGDASMAMMERFFRGRRERDRDRDRDEGPLSQGTGSGFIIDGKGLVLTNNHVVEEAVNIRVRLDDGRALEAEVVGRDPLTDVAVIRLKGKFEALPTVKLGDSSVLRVGDWVVAIGNPFGLAQSVSAGIISALDRQIGATQYDQFLQTDAAINPGNSGGPLFNLRGEVIGMNTAIIGAATGIGFAVPSNLMKALVPQLEKQGHVTRGWLGVAVQELTPPLAKALGVPAGEGALIASVNENAPAHRAGVKDDDVVTAVDGERITSSLALTRLVALKRPDSTVTLSILRGGKPMEVKVTLGTRPNLDGNGVERKSEEHAENNRRVGLSLANVDAGATDANGAPLRGALITDVLGGSPAEQAGLRAGMIVVEANRKAIKNREELVSLLRGLKSGSVALLRVVASQNPSSRTLIAVEIP